MGPLPYMKFWQKEYLASSDTRRLSLAAKGCLFDMLMFQWEDGRLPADPAALARMVGSDRTEFCSVWPEIEGMFEPAGDGWIRHPKLHAEREEAIALVAQNKENGRRGGRPPKDEANPSPNRKESETKPTGFDSVNRKESEGKAKAKRTPNRNETERLTETKGIPEPYTDNPPSANADAPPTGEQLPSSLDTPAFRQAWTEWQAHLKHKGRKCGTPEALRKHLEKLSPLGEAEAIRWLHHAIFRGWQAPFQPRGDGWEKKVQPTPSLAASAARGMLREA
jgi:uncharacterized protein YdaU (DUF1376 family)